jgi:hypothetical protein
LGACSDVHVFEVDVGNTEPDRADLTLYQATTPMQRTGGGFVGRRDHRGDGSGEITIHYGDSEPITCAIGYVTSGEFEPHRFIIEGDECRAL